MGKERLISREFVELAIEEFRRLGRTKFLKKYGFGKARQYFIRIPNSDEWLDSKAIAGAAYGFQFPNRGPLTPDSFSGGEPTVAARLKTLGFNVVTTGEDWISDEILLILDDYFEMLALEASGVAYNKAGRNRALRSRLTPRTRGSVERKHQNISAVLHEHGLPFITGYKPSSNAQKLLEQKVLAYIDAHVEALEKIFKALEMAPEQTPVLSNEGSLTITPPISGTTQGYSRRRIPRKIDFAARDERNRMLGRSGEEWVVQYERDRLTRAGRPDLADAVEWVSDHQGDGAGYDIQSKEVDGSNLFIEVKTTNGGELTSFLLTTCEVECARELGPKFKLYRVFDFLRNPRLFVVSGPLTTLSLEPCMYRIQFPASLQ